MAEPVGTLAIVLHAHLPYIRHPEHRYHLEENWLYEAVTATYLPLLEVWRGLAQDGVHFRVTMSMSPPLCEMLRDDLLKSRTAAYLDRLVELGAKERARTAGDAAFGRLAAWYHDRFIRLKGLYDEIRGDIVDAYRRLQDDGVLEIVTVGATHGYQPTLRDPAARRAQIQVAAHNYRKHFGRWPRGIWLPECGYAEGIEEHLAEAGIRFFFVDGHGLIFGRPRPPFGTAAPVYTRAGVAAFGRDLGVAPHCARDRVLHGVADAVDDLVLEDGFGELAVDAAVDGEVAGVEVVHGDPIHGDAGGAAGVVAGEGQVRRHPHRVRPGPRRVVGAVARERVEQDLLLEGHVAGGAAAGAHLEADVVLARREVEPLGVAAARREVERHLAGAVG
jgi:hypothetical protein